jgi:hypothetical protein
MVSVDFEQVLATGHVLAALSALGAAVVLLPSLVTIAVGLSPFLLGKRSPTVMTTHAYCMTWSYAGLVAAGCGQLTVAVGQDVGAWIVPLAIATVLAISGVVIFGRVPSTLDRMGLLR